MEKIRDLSELSEEVAEIVVSLQKKTPEQREQLKNECVEYANSLSTFSREFILKMLIVIDKYLEKSA